MLPFTVRVKLASPTFLVVGEILVVVGTGLGAGLSAIKIPPFRCGAESVAAPAPVAPAIAFVAHAAPTDAMLPVLFWLSYSSASVPGDVVVQPDQVGLELAAIPNIITTALAEAVFIEVADTAVVLFADTEIVPGATSKGVAPDVSTPENATIEPTAPVVPVPRANV